ncbi:MAG: hypothetical protein Q9160_008414 [Pyrenula sp. 1 TL-2023]
MRDPAQPSNPSPQAPPQTPPAPASPTPTAPRPAPPSSLPDPITSISADLTQLNGFYKIRISPTRRSRLKEYYTTELHNLQNSVNFTQLSQEDRVDYILLSGYLQHQQRELELETERDGKMKPLLSGWADEVVGLCELRQSHDSESELSAEETAGRVDKIRERLEEVLSGVKRGSGDEGDKKKEGGVSVDRVTAYRAARTIADLSGQMAEWFGFYDGYDPLFTWWVVTPYEGAQAAMRELAAAIREVFLGVEPGSGDNGEDVIVGQPIGRAGLGADLEVEKIAYSPEELVEIGENEYVWCEAEMQKAGRDLGYENWRDGLEEVKNKFVAPGSQPRLVHDLASEALTYVQTNDLVTVPPIAAETWRTLMISPQNQKTSPFFLGGRDMQISYPTSSMSHTEKLQAMRGNNIYFSRATVFHEMIPGHRLQYHMNQRHRPYRNLLFGTPFWREGWALYWEMVFWEKGFFHRYAAKSKEESARNRIGTLFWRMHRCARIVFSIKFHLGEWSPGECIEYLVEKVGHERATAEGEVRRSLNGDYSPLYQAGYMVGALQLWALRGEVLGSGDGKMGEKEFHDRILRENEMPIEVLRALLRDLPLEEGYQANWRFYDGVENMRT